MSEPSDEFVESFGEKLGILLSHSFIATQQSMFYDQCKSSLKPGEIVVSADFSENYAFILQDAAQGFHWNNSQATIHPFVAYFRESDSINHLSFVIISDKLHHDTIAVYLYQKRLIAHDSLSTIPMGFREYTKSHLLLLLLKRKISPGTAFPEIQDNPWHSRLALICSYFKKYFTN